MTTTERRTVPGAADTTIDDVTNWWRTDISDISPGVIRYHGFAIEDIIPTTSYAAMVWLMIRGERRFEFCAQFVAARLPVIALREPGIVDEVFAFDQLAQDLELFLFVGGDVQ